MPTLKGKLVEFFKSKTDDRGRVNLGSEFANRDDIMVFVVENPEFQVEIVDEVDE